MAVIKPVDVQKIHEENPNSRFKVTNVAILNPGVCFVCKSSGGDGRQFVDYGETIDFYGVVYVCTYCVAEVAKVLGFVTPAEVDVMKGQINALNDFLGEMTTERAQFAEALDAARILLRNCHCDPDSTNPTVLDSLETNPEPEPADSDPDESGDVEGSSDISTASDDDKPIPKQRKPRANPPAE